MGPTLQKNCVLLNTIEEVEYLFQSQRALLEQSPPIALTAETDYICKKLGLQYSTIEDYYSDPDLMTTGIENFKNVENFCLKLETFLREALPTSELVMSPFEYFYHFKALFDTFLHRGSALSQLIESTHPRSIATFESSSIEGRTSQDWLFSNDLSQILVAKICEQRGIAHKSIEPPNQPYQKNNYRSTWLYEAAKRLIAPYVRYAFGSAPRTRTLAKISSAKNILVVDTQHFDMFPDLISKWKNTPGNEILTQEEILSTLCVSDIRFVNKKYDQVAKSLGHVLEQTFATKEFSDIAHVMGVDYSQYIQGAIKDIAFTHLLSSQIKLIKYNIALKALSKKTTCVLLGEGNKALSRAARHLGLVTYYAQHGGGYGYCHFPMFEYSAYYGVDSVLTGGQGVKDFFDTAHTYLPLRGKSQKATSIPTGLSSLDNLIKKRTQIKPAGKKIKVVYGIATLHGDHRYFNYNALPDIEYWRLNRRVVGLFANSKNFELIVKMPPNDPVRKIHALNPIKLWATDNGLKNVTFEETIPFYELMWEADLLIIDIPSTMLLQATTTKTPILLMSDTRWINMTQHAEHLLKKRASVYPNLELFLSGIKNHVDHPERIVPIDEPNDEFIKSFGIHLGDGLATDRVLNILQDS